MQDIRAQQLLSWLSTQVIVGDGQLTPLAGDASFRRYFRWYGAAGDHAIVMDAPPPKEDVRPFLQVRDYLQILSVPVPACYAQQCEQGWLVLEDFGDTTLAKVVADGDDVLIDRCYRQALTQLAQWQAHPQQAAIMRALPVYDAHLLVNEMQLFPEWLCAQHCQQPLTAFEQSDWQQWMRLLTGSALVQPRVLVHRDYHSRNLMLCSDGRMGVLDFQDAVQGPITYDVMSLLRDAYIQLPDQQLQEWLRFYFMQLVQAGVYHQDDWESFVRAADWMGVQRHLKILGIFARLYHRDGKNHYLQHLPLVLHYLIDVSKRYDALVPLARWLDQRLSRQFSTGL